MTGLRVGYVLGTTSGGTGRHAAMLAAGCLREGLGVFAFGPEQTRSLFSGGVRGTVGANSSSVVAFEPVEITDRPRPVRDTAAVHRLRRLLTQASLDVVHAHGLRAAALAALALRPVPPFRGPDRPPPALIVTVHNAPPTGTGTAAVYGVLERLVARRADAVLCVSPDLAARMRRLGARDVALAVVPAPAAEPPAVGSEPGAVRAEFGADGRPAVLAVGRLTDQKGFDTLLAAAACWQDRRPAPLLVIAGEGPLEAQLTSRARSLGVAARFLGVRHDVPALLAAADVFVLPSRWEGQPLVLQEALRAGRPIVAAAVGGVPDLTGPGAALLVPPAEPAALAEAVLRVLDDQELSGRLAAAARTRAGELPSEADAVRAALAVYDRLAARPSHDA